jgi:hypothetical protein
MYYCKLKCLASFFFKKLSRLALEGWYR